MVRAQYSRRDFISQVLIASGGALLLAGCTSGGAGAQRGTAADLPPVEGGKVLTDPAVFPAKFAESPDFAKLVAAGKLPPVAERIGQDPLVIKPVQAIGKYGGELRRGFITAGDVQNGHRFCAGPDSFFYWDPQWHDIVPNIARGYELSRDGKVLTVQLRRGMRWSDGVPFTADDVLFWREDISLDDTLSVGSTALTVDGKPVRVAKLDDHTVEYVSPVPYPNLVRMLASSTDVGGMTNVGSTGGGGFAPKHYLTKFHAKYVSESTANGLAKAAGFTSWTLYLLHQMSWVLNTELPLLTPWTVTRPINDPPWTFAANPYSVWVDSDGNQLPYIGKITMRDAGNSDVLNLQAIAGEYDFQDRGLPLASLPALLKGQQSGKYTIHRAPSTQHDFMLRLNLAYDKDKTIGDLLRTVEFRRALSLAIDREQINQTFFLGSGVATAAMVADSSPYFPGREWRTKWATLDVARANKLLDGIGLTKRDGDGFRIRPDGAGKIELAYAATKSFGDFPAIGELIKKEWRKIGIDTTVELVQPNLVAEQVFANELMIQGIGGFSSDVFLKPDGVLPVNSVQGTMGIPYAKWFLSGGKTGVRPPDSLGLDKAMQLYQRGLEAADAERVDIGKQIYQLHADQVWSIGVIGFGLAVYGIYYAKNNLGNVPRRVINDELLRSPINTLPMTFYYK